MNKLALGTAQFGLDYGINNRRGKIPVNEVFAILNYAFTKKIDTLDTAHDYGDSEKIIGQYLHATNQSFKIISKSAPLSPKHLDAFFYQSLKNLKVNNLYGYLIHDFDKFKANPAILSQLQKYKKRGRVKKIGFSLYYPHQLEYLLKNKVKFDLIQIPFSIFDQRFVSYLPKLKSNSIEVYARSIFLQGLVFKKIADLPKKILKIKPKLQSLSKISKKWQIPIAAVCLNFVWNNRYIDKVVIGVDSKKNLEENINNIGFVKIIEKEEVTRQLTLLKEDDETIILPINWS